MGAGPASHPGPSRPSQPGPFPMNFPAFVNLCPSHRKCLAVSYSSCPNGAFFFFWFQILSSVVSLFWLRSSPREAPGVRWAAEITQPVHLVRNATILEESAFEKINSNSTWRVPLQWLTPSGLGSPGPGLHRCPCWKSGHCLGEGCPAHRCQDLSLNCPEERDG